MPSMCLHIDLRRHLRQRYVRRRENTASASLYHFVNLGSSQQECSQSKIFKIRNTIKRCGLTVLRFFTRSLHISQETIGVNCTRQCLPAFCNCRFEFFGIQDFVIHSPCKSKYEHRGTSSFFSSKIIWIMKTR